MTNWPYNTPGIPDSMFIRGKVPMTKEEIRAVSISKLRILEKDIILDIGAGTGSLSIEASLQAKKGQVYSIERKEEGINLIKENIKKFNVCNIKPIKGIAPIDLENISTVDKAILGGSGGKMREIIIWLSKNLNKNGRIVINTITIENLYKAMKYLKENNFKDIELTQIGVSKGKDLANLTMLKANNPIYIISADKGR
ncbi:MAG: precorrin-6Y C5,15-methyltransferase (decarboxylating) subunit CbiT [Firmicutes bacterium]|nr:precorrin-6Y C5,15-methyltransferase (decarboxylating) subunit CbiT [Bacillota bacterium]